MTRNQLKALERDVYGRAPSPLASLSDEDLADALRALTTGRAVPPAIAERIDAALLAMPRDPALARLTDAQLARALEAHRPR